MSRAEFMSRLTALLQDVPPAEREEAIAYYNEYFDDAGEGNEAGVIAALGSPEELAKAIKAGLFDGGNEGEFTESGFHGYEQRNKNQLMSTEEAQSGEQTDGTGNTYGQQANGGGNAYGQQMNGGGNAYGQQTAGAGSAYGYQQQTGNGQRNGQGIPQKKPMTGGQIALIIVLAVLLSPVWIGVLGGLFGGGVGILAGLFGIFLAFLVVGVVLTVVGVALALAGFVAMFGAPLGGLSMIGGGLVMVAVGLVFVWLMVLVVGTAIPALFRGCVNLCHRLFHRGGV
ncbi:MAG: DUF1700 domain-containing protein [Lachnospiraceae bacterium]|nr:DUF1700 domain-containing protein [Lachnospiraceae bacterium]